MNLENIKAYAVAFGAAVRGFRDRIADWAHAHKNTTAFLLIVGTPLALVTLIRFAFSAAR